MRERTMSRVPIAGEGDPTDRQVDQSVYRVRLRINEELARDIEVLEDHRPDLLEELRDVVCNGGQEVSE